MNDWLEVAIVLAVVALLAAAAFVDLLRIQRCSRRREQSVQRFRERHAEDVAWALFRDDDYRLAMRISLTRADELATVHQVVDVRDRRRPSLEVVA